MKLDLKRLVDTAKSLSVALFFALLIRAYVAQAFTIPSGSMEDTLQVHDMLIANRLIFRARRLFPQFMPEGRECRDKTTGTLHIVCRREVVIFMAPRTIHRRRAIHLYIADIPYPPSLQSLCEKTLCRRICPSCVWEWKDYIKRVIGLPNETVEVRDGYVWINGERIENEFYIKEPPDYAFGPLKLKKDEIFVMGDNRNNSEDSHIWGPLKLKYLRGKAVLIYWPFHRTQFIF